MRLKFKILALLLHLSFISFSQKGTIRGKVRDSQTKEALIGATIRVQGTTQAAATDIEGFFSLSSVDIGTQTLFISYISYKDLKVENVKVVENSVSEIELEMTPDNSTLAEVVITAKRLTDTEISVISEIRAAQMIVNGISAQQIGKSLDRDAAQVAKRIPGVTISGDRFLVIRGLNQRYNNVMLHNVFTPSMETDVKSFSFDIIPSGQIDRLLIYKSPDAELPGEFAGGIVKIFTKNIPDKNGLEFNYNIGLRENTTFKDFQFGQSGSNFWTGFNNDFQNLPRFFPESISSVSNNPELLTQAGRMLRNNWTAQTKMATPDQRFSITGNYTKSIGNFKFGNVTSLNYSDSRTTFLINRADFDATDGAKLSPIYEFVDNQYSRNVKVGILHNWSFKFNNNHSVDFKNLFNQLSNARYVDRGGRHIEQNRGVSDHSFDQIYRGIYTGQLLGNHKFNSGKTVFDWVVGYNNSFRNQPDFRRYRADVVNNRTSLYIPVGSAQAFFLGRFSSDMDETMQSANVSLTQFIKMGKNREAEIKAGFYYEDKKREFNARNLGYVRSSSANFDNNLFLGSIDNLFQPNNINNSNGIRIDEQTNPSDSYKATNKQFAYFAKANVPLSDKLNVITGLRVEDNTQGIQSAFIGGQPVDNKFPVLSVLPSVNLTYNFDEKRLLRLAYGKTLNRPEFRETAPFAFFDFDYNFVYKGNQNLIPATIHNYDLRFEFYPSPSEVISVATFYKQFYNTIETFVEPGAGSGGAKTFTFRNGEKAYSLGTEIEFKKNLGSWIKSNFGNKLSALFNTAIIYSRVNLGAQGVGQSDNRPLQGQSPFIINSGLSYNDQEKDFQLNVMYNVIGRRIFAVGFEFYPDLYEIPRNIIDISFSKGIGKKLTLQGGVNDILNNKNLLMQDANGDGKFKTSEDQINAGFNPGRLYNLGIKYRIF
jgi:TonB-dependent receptor